MKEMLCRFSCVTILLVVSGCDGGQNAPSQTREQADLQSALPRDFVTRSLSGAQTLYRVVAEDRYLDYSTTAAYRTLGRGWQTLDRKLFVGESWIWATGLTADINLTVLDPRDLLVTMRLRPHYLENLPAQVVDIWWEKTHLSTVEFDKNRGWSPVDVTMRVPASAQRTGANLITFHSRHAVAQQLVGAGNEVRQASFGLCLAELTPVEGSLDSSEASAPAHPDEASLVRFLESGVEQGPHCELVMPLRLPAPGPVYLQIHNARNTLTKGGRVTLRWDTVEGPMSRVLTDSTADVDKDNSWFWDIGSLSSEVVELIFGNAGSAAILWETPSIRYPGQHVAKSPTRAPPKADWPSTQNVVLVVLDALRADALGCYGALQPTSPFIDSLAAQGILFDRCYASGTYTFASTTSLLTSLHPFQHKVVYWKDRLGDASLLLQNALKREGIATACVSQNPFLSPENVLGDGFDFFEGVFATDPGAAQRVTEEALKFAAQTKGRPFFLYVHYLPPHAPYSMAGEFEGTLSVDPLMQLDVTPEAIKAMNWGTRPANPNTIEQLRARYDENVRMADQLVADLIQGLRDLGMGEETTLILTADHGEEFLEHGWVGHGSYPYNTVAHIPLLVTTFNEIGVQARRRSDVVGTVDIYPTVCRLLGVEPAQTISGHDLLTFPSHEATQDEVLAYSRGNEEDGYGAFYFKKYKYIRADNRQWHALFDLERDPAEATDLCEVLPVLHNYIAVTSSAWEHAHSARFELSDTEADGVDISHEQELRALGYL